METPYQYQNRITIERYAECAALFQIRGASFTHCLRLNHLDTERSIVGEDGNTVLLRGQDLSNQKTWTSFLTQTARPPIVALDTRQVRLQPPTSNGYARRIPGAIRSY